MSTLFISHKSSGRDNLVAKDLMARLADRKHNSLFLDLDEEKGIVGGRSWEQTLYRNVRACRAVIALLSNDYLRSHWCFAELALARMEGKHLIPLEIERLDDKLIPQILTATQRINVHDDPEAGYRRLFKSLEELDLLGEEGDWDPKQSPYLGLATFEDKHAPLFFGRDDEIRVGIELLDRGAPDLVMVLGSSGSGKSSLVRAGIVPRLRRQEDRWLVVGPFRPRRDPFAELAEALAKAYQRYAPDEAKESGSRSRMRELLGAGADPAASSDAAGEPDPAAPLEDDARVRRLLEQLEELRLEPPAAGGAPLKSFLDLSLAELRQIFTGRPAAETAEPTRDGLPDLADIADELRRASGHDDARVLLVVDQFEELLGHGASGDRPSRFLEMVRQALEIDDGPLMALGTMRSDFLGLFQQSRELLGIDYEKLSVGPMSEDGLTRVITKPAERGAVTLDDGLPNLLLKDVGTPDALPLLSFTLRTLWEKRDDDGRLRLDHYRQLGGLQGAIAREAQAILDRHRDREDDLKRAFLEMARLTEDGHYARRTVGWGEAPIAEAEGILRDFVENRLLVSGQDERGEPTVEVAHEALFRSWPPLVAWLDENRSEHLLKEQLRRDAGTWAEGGRRAEVLWRGGRLQQAAELMRRSSSGGAGSQRSVEEEFVREGVWQQRRRWLALAASVTGVVVALTLLTITAMIARREAERERTIATSRQLAAESQSGFVLDAKGAMFRSADLSMLLGVAGYRTAHWTIESRGAVLSLLDRTPWLERFVVPPQEVLTSRARPLRVSGLVLRPGDGALAATVSGIVPPGDDAGKAPPVDGVVLLDPGGDEEVGPLLATGSIQSIAFGPPDGALLATANGSGTVTLWNVATGGREHELEGVLPVLDVAFDRSGQVLASGLINGAVQLWNVATREPLIPSFQAHRGAVRTVTFSPITELFATGGQDGQVRLWQRSGAEASTIAFADSGLTGDLAIKDVEFSADGSLLAWTAGNGVVVWDLKEKRPRHVLAADRGEMLVGVAFDSTAGRVAAGSSSGAVRLWEVAGGGPLGEPLRGHNRLVDGLTFSADDKSLFSLSWDGSLIRWTVPDRASSARSPLASSPGRLATTVITLAFSHDGKWLAARDAAGLEVWEAESGRVALEREASIFSPTGVGDLVAFDRTGRRVALGTDDGRVLVLDVESGDLAFEIPSRERSRVLALAFSPTADLLASADQAGMLLLSSSLDGSRIHRLRAHADNVTTLTFSPNGRILVTAAIDEGIVLRDGACGLPLGPALAPAHDPVAYDYAFSPDGGMLASVGEDRALILWDLAAIRPRPGSGGACPEEAGRVAEWPQGAGPKEMDRFDVGTLVTSVAFNGDASLLATASSDRVDLFETSPLRRLGSLIPAAGASEVRGVAFRPGKPLLASNHQGEVLVWDVDFESWVSRLCEKANRELSSEERSRYLDPATSVPLCSDPARASSG